MQRNLNVSVQYIKGEIMALSVEQYRKFNGLDPYLKVSTVVSLAEKKAINAEKEFKGLTPAEIRDGLEELKIEMSDAEIIKGIEEAEKNILAPSFKNTEKGLVQGYVIDKIQKEVIDHLLENELRFAKKRYEIFV